MKRVILALLFALALPAPAFAKSYTNGIDANYPPFTYVDEKDGQPSGFDVESLNWIAKTMGFEIKHIPIAWGAIIPALLAQKIDMVCSGMGITQERAKQVTFSDPYWKSYDVFVTKAESELTVNAILASKLKLGGQRGTYSAIALVNVRKKQQLNFELRLYDSALLMIEDVISGRIDAALTDSLPAQNAIAKGRPIRIAGIHGDAVFFGVAFRKDDIKLQQVVNEGYKKLMADPFWKQLQQKYSVQPLD